MFVTIKVLLTCMPASGDVKSTLGSIMLYFSAIDHFTQQKSLKLKSKKSCRREINLTVAGALPAQVDKRSPPTSVNRTRRLMWFDLLHSFFS